jgi:molybdopterin synthase catalytic subunit
MNFNKLISTLKAHSEHHKVGMIASHLGIVRGASRNGREITGMEVAHDKETINNIIRDIKRLPGIVEVLVYTNEGHLKTGDEILAVAVAGDIRERVFPALIKTVNRIKEEATQKKEFFDSPDH